MMKTRLKKTSQVQGREQREQHQLQVSEQVWIEGERESERGGGEVALIGCAVARLVRAI